jgi:hypothetical protein
VALTVAALTGLFAMVRLIHDPAFSSDLDHLWFAARALLHGDNPYEAVGPGRPFEWAWPLFYPLPALLLIAPFSFLPIAAARVAVSVLFGGVLGYAVGARWRVLWPMFLSASYFIAISRNQWSPLILAAFWLPWLGFIAVAKPNVGLLPLLAQDRRALMRTAVLSLALVVLSLLVRPSWPGEWFALARSAPNKEIALLQPLGLLLLGALVLWRSIDGRVLLATAVMPQTPSLYDVLPLFVLCRTTRQALVLSALSHVLQWAALALGPYASYDAYYASLARLNVVIVLIPLTLVALGNKYQLAERLRGSLARTKPRVGRGISRAWWLIDRLLVAAVAMSLGVQIKIFFL